MSTVEDGFFGPRIVNPSFGGGSNDKLWRGHIQMYVDSELKNEWLDRLNAIPGVAISSLCAGGREHSSDSPQILFHHGHAKNWPASKKEAYRLLVLGLFSGLGSIGMIDQSDSSMCRIAFMLTASKTRLLMTDEDFDGWWSAVIETLEGLPAVIPVELT